MIRVCIGLSVWLSVRPVRYSGLVLMYLKEYDIYVFIYIFRYALLTRQTAVSSVLPEGP